MERNLIAVYNMNGSYYLYIKELQNPDDSYCANLIMCRGIIECKIAISELKKYKAYADKDREYIDMLKTMAQYYGYEPDIVDELLEGGFSTDEIEEYIYADGIEEI